MAGAGFWWRQLGTSLTTEAAAQLFMKAFLLCTPSHRELLAKYLIPSLPNDIDLLVKQGQQHCGTGDFMEDGWLDCMRDKVQMLVDAIDDNPGECLLHVDADIQFFVPELEPVLAGYLERSDFVAQSDGPRRGSDIFCGGLFAFRANEPIRRLFEMVLQIMDEKKINDQEALNVAVGRLQVAADFLNDDHFWSPRARWEPGMHLDLSPCAVAHHANWCTGVPAKIAQLDEAKRLRTMWTGLERHGSYYGGKWIRENSLDESSIIYSAGTGEDISFDISILDRYGAVVHAFDPTPRAIDFASEFAAMEPKFQFEPIGVSGAQTGKATFHMPKNPEHVSCTQFDNGGEPIDLEVKPIAQLMAEFGHDHIDLFKMDIEGAEYELLEHILSMDPPLLPRQLLIEFHDPLASGLADRKVKIVSGLLERGYQLNYQDGPDYSFFMADHEIENEEGGEPAADAEAQGEDLQTVGGEVAE